MLSFKLSWSCLVIIPYCAAGMLNKASPECKCRIKHSEVKCLRECVDVCMRNACSVHILVRNEVVHLLFRNLMR